MSRVQLKGLGFSPVVDVQGNVQSGRAFTLQTLGGSPTDIPVYAAATGPTTLTTQQKVTDAAGVPQGFVDPCSGTFACAGVSAQVEVVSGGDVAAHQAATTNVHGIADTSQLATVSQVAPVADPSTLGKVQLGSVAPDPLHPTVPVLDSSGRITNYRINVSVNDIALPYQINLGHIMPTSGPGGTSTTDTFSLITGAEQYNNTNAATPTSVAYRGIGSSVVYGVQGGTAATGSVWSMNTVVDVKNAANAGSEQVGIFGYVRYSAGSPGRAWFTDWGVHGPVAAQPNLLSGINMVMNNHYNGSASSGPIYGVAVLSQRGAGPGNMAATVYPSDIGMWVLGKAEAGSGRSFETAFHAGGTGGGQDSGWNVATSRIGTGFKARDWETAGFLADQSYTGGGAGPGFSFIPRVGNQVLIQAQEVGDTVPRFSILEAGKMQWSVGAAYDTALERITSGVLRISYVLGFQQVPIGPPAGQAGSARLFSQLNGSSKMQLLVQMPSGSPIVLATEP